MRGVAVMIKILILYLLLLASLLNAGTAIDCLAEGTGVRALGLGGAFSAMPGSPAAPAYNPGALGEVKNTEAMSSSFQYFDSDVSRFALDVAYPMAGSVWAFNFIQEGVTDIPLTRDDGNNQPEAYGSFNSQSRCLNVSLAQELVPHKSYWGASLKYFTAELYQETASGWGLDVGIWQQLTPSVNVALSAKNILPVQLAWSTGHTDEIPLTVIAGIAYQASLWDRSIWLSADLDLLVKNQPARFSYGLEVWFWQQNEIHIALRLGRNRQESITAGLGFNYRKFILDVAFQNHSLGSSNQIALGYRF